MEWPLLRDLPEEERRTFLGLARRRRYARNEVIFHEGDPGETLHLIESGRVGTRVTSLHGDVMTVFLFGPGDFFGELALVSSSRHRIATVCALEPTETLAIHRDRFEELRRSHPSIDHVLSELLADKLARVTDLLIEALYVPAEMRVLRRLAALLDTYGDGEAATVVPLIQDELASLAGTTRPTVNRALRRAADDGVVRLSRGRIEVLDTAELCRRARFPFEER